MYVVDLITQLRSFVAVAESGSFTAGAIDVRAPQPVVSRRIMALEKHLGTVLFVRSARRIRITEAGQRLLPHAADLVARADRLVELATTYQDRVLRIGVPADIDLGAMAAGAAAVRPLGFDLQVVAADREVRRTQLDAGVLQVALLDAAVDTADLVVRLGAGQARAGDRPFHFDELRRDRSRRAAAPGRIHLGPEDDVPEVRRQITERIARAGLSPAQFEVADSLASAITRVHATTDVILCSRPLAARHNLTWRPLGGEDLLRCYAIGTNLPAAWDTLPAQLAGTLAPDLARALGGIPATNLDQTTARSLAPRHDLG